MPYFYLKADYNRNGVLESGTTEYGFRQTTPGAVLTPNLDVDGLALPSSVSCGSPPRLDITNTTKPANDNDLIPLVVTADATTTVANYSVQLSISDYDAQKIRLYDGSRTLIRGSSSGGVTIFPISFPAPGSVSVNLFLEAITIAGSPSITLSPPSTQPSIPSDVESCIINLAVTEIATGNIVQQDFSIFTPSPLLLLGDLAPAEKLYMCSINGNSPSMEDNFPSFTDVRNAVNVIRGVSFVEVPLAVNFGDSWMQDQFQVGYCQGANTNLKVIFHLPRLRSDSRLAAAGNGLTCIATNHFPSADLGVFNDFWTRTIPVRDVSAGIQNIPFTQTVELQIVFDSVFALNAYFLRIIMETAPSRFQNFTSHYLNGVGEIINSLEDFKNDVVGILDDALRQTTDSVRRQRLNNTKTDVQNSVTILSTIINFRRDGALQVRTQNLNLALEPDDIDNLTTKLAQLHSSHNYGGNIEVSPPMSTAPLGKIVIGNAPEGSGNTTPMDPDLVSFMVKQAKQPIVVVDTNWLQVGHVDEVINFAGLGSGNGFVIALGSPAKAQQILEEIFLLNTRDLSVDSPDKELYGRPNSTGDASMARGPHPVTKLLRGKSWLQAYRQNGTPLFPPSMYRAMNAYYGDIGASTRRFYPVPWNDIHYYDASLSVREINYFSRNSNDAVANKVDTIQQQLQQEFSNTMIMEFPVIFDIYNPNYEKTIAFTPDLVNYQSLNNHVVLPRPFGPRMSIADALAVLRNVLGSNYSSYLTSQYIRQKNLHRTFHWAISPINQLSHVSTGIYNRPVNVDLDWFADQFKDGFFPQTSDPEQIKRSIRTANPGKFMPNGALRSGWQLVEIPENKVDLFEAYTQILFESIGQTVHWVDSWYYHLRSGGIHCGTNVIRTPDRNPRNVWWNVFPSDSMGPGDYNIPNGDSANA